MLKKLLSRFEIYIEIYLPWESLFGFFFLATKLSVATFLKLNTWPASRQSQRKVLFSKLLPSCFIAIVGGGIGMVKKMAKRSQGRGKQIKAHQSEIGLFHVFPGFSIFLPDDCAPCAKTQNKTRLSAVNTRSPCPRYCRDICGWGRLALADFHALAAARTG